MTSVYLLTDWIGDGLTPETAYRPRAIDDFVIKHYTNVTGGEVVPSPNAVIIEISDGPDLIATIEAHPDYGPGAILYDLPNPYPPNGTPDAAEYGKRRSYCAKLGISLTQFRAMFGTQANPNTRKQGADNAIAWAKTLPKGQTK